MTVQAFHADRLFDGHAFVAGALVVEDGVIAHLGDVPHGVPLHHLGPGVIAPGFVDLQVNGGDGVMLDDDVATLHRMAAAHARLGATSIFATLITDTPQMTRGVVDMFAKAQVPGVAGLHLEGPHLSIARKGAHDATLIRPMTDEDLAFLLQAAPRVGRLMLTIAPENVSLAQTRALAAAGVIVALGHTDCSHATALAYVDAGARVATHLFNAMSQLQNREPGLVGAVLTDARLDAGIIADGLHVHPATLMAALAAKRAGDLFLVSDAMAVAGTDLDAFTLKGRMILRRQGRLTLPDGTLAGADLDLACAMRVLLAAGVPDARALAMATSIPARVAGIGAGRLMPGAAADFVHLSPDLTLRATWRRAIPVA